MRKLVVKLSRQHSIFRQPSPLQFLPAATLELLDTSESGHFQLSAPDFLHRPLPLCAESRLATDGVSFT